MSAAVLLLAAAVVVFVGEWLAPRQRAWPIFGLLSLLAAGAVLGEWLALPGAAAAAHPHDPLGRFVAWTGLVISALTICAAIGLGGDDRPRGDRTAGLLVMLAGLVLTTAATDVVSLFLAAELVWLPAVLLAGADRERLHRPAQEPGRLAPSFVSTLLLLVGLALLAALGGTIALPGIRAALAVAYTPEAPAQAIGAGSALGKTALVLIVAAAGTRLGLACFEGEGFGPLTQLAAFVVLARVPAAALPGYETHAQLVLGVPALGALVVGGLLSVAQTRMGPTLAAIAVAHAGLVLCGLTAGVWQHAPAPLQSGAVGGLPGGTVAAAAFLAASLLAATGWRTLIEGMRFNGRRIEYAEELAGLVRSSPLPAACALVLLAALAALPPLATFWGLLYVIGAALAVPGTSAFGGSANLFVLLAIAAALALFLAACALARLAAAIVFDPPAGTPQLVGGRWGMAAALIAAAALLAAGLVPGMVLASFK
ncbi:MAG: hypothetical protein KY476_05150 [Planctomycetes bacterium]|nr:hypothetical protein [Planctomycetota bacterium]